MNRFRDFFKIDYSPERNEGEELESVTVETNFDPKISWEKRLDPVGFYKVSLLDGFDPLQNLPQDDRNEKVNANLHFIQLEFDKNIAHANITIWEDKIKKFAHPFELISYLSGKANNHPGQNVVDKGYFVIWADKQGQKWKMHCSYYELKDYLSVTKLKPDSQTGVDSVAVGTDFQN